MCCCGPDGSQPAIMSVTRHAGAHLQRTFSRARDIVAIVRRGKIEGLVNHVVDSTPNASEERRTVRRS